MQSTLIGKTLHPINKFPRNLSIICSNVVTNTYHLRCYDRRARQKHVQLHLLLVMLLSKEVKKHLWSLLLLFQLVLENVNLVLLLCESFIHCRKMLAHHAQLSLIATRRRLQLVLSHRNTLKSHPQDSGSSHCTRTHTHTRTHAHTHPFNGLLSGTTQMSQYQKGRTIWILLKQETVSGSGISWAICKSAPCSTPAPHHLVFLQAGCPSCRPTNSVKALNILYNTIISLHPNVSIFLFGWYRKQIFNYQQNPYRTIVYISPRILHIPEMFIFYADKVSVTGHSGNSCVFNFAILFNTRKPRKSDEHEIFMFYSSSQLSPLTTTLSSSLHG